MSQSSKGKRLPEGKVVLYCYVKAENKTYFEKQANLVGGKSKAMDILLDDLRCEKKKLVVSFSAVSIEK